MRTFLIIGWMISLCLPEPALAAKPYAAPGTPTRAIQDLDDLLDSYILRPTTDEQKQFNSDLKKKILQGTFDLRELCQRALDRHWKELKGKEQDRFVERMTRLLEKKAIFTKERETKETKSKAVYGIIYEGEKYLNPEKSLALTHTAVKIPSENLTISIDYKLTRSENQWKIYDVIVDEASLVDNYRYQFDKIIREHGYEDLVRRMDSKLSELEAKEGGTVVLPSAEPPPPPQRSRFGCTLFP